MPELTLSIGSNIDAVKNLRKTFMRLVAVFGHVRCSKVYESEAVGFAGDNFLNMVAVISTEEPLDTVVPCLKNIEDELGRDRTQPKFSGRTIDIDILTYGDVVGLIAGIELPRAEITCNAFVLCPLAEVLPETRHPGTGLTYRELWDAYDKQQQKLWPIPFEWPDQPIAASMLT